MYQTDNNVSWVNLKQKQLSMCIGNKVYVCIKSRSLDHATLAFKLNGIIKKINQRDHNQ